MKDAVRITVTGAAGQIGYALLFRIAAGEMLGKDQPVILQLLEITPVLDALRGVIMEVEDCAFPLVQGIHGTDDADLAFKDAEYALLVGSRPRSKGMERKDLIAANAEIFSVQGKAINDHAHGDIKIMVVGNPANTNCLIAQRNAPDIARFVLVSSLTVMGPSQDGRPVSAGAYPNPVTHYGRSKLAAERAARAEAHSLPITIIRPPMIYGPRDREILPFFKSVQLGVLPLTGSPSSKLSAIYAADCAAACIKALDAHVPSGSTYFVEDGGLESLGGLIEHIERALGKRAWLRVPVPRFLMYAAALGSELYGRIMGRAVMLTRDKLNELLAPHWVCDSGEAQAALGWKPRISFEEGTRITGAWYRREGWL